MFQSLQNLFITKYSLYVFVFNLTNLTYVQKIHETKKNYDRLREKTVLDLSFWLNSVSLDLFAHVWCDVLLSSRYAFMHLKHRICSSVPAWTSWPPPLQ